MAAPPVGSGPTPKEKHAKCGRMETVSAPLTIHLPRTNVNTRAKRLTDGRMNARCNQVLKHPPMRLLLQTRPCLAGVKESF